MCFWFNGYLTFEPQGSSWIFLPHFWYRRNCNFYANRISKYGSSLCNLYFNNSKNMLPFSAEPLLSTLSTMHPSDNSPEDIIASWLMNQVRLVPNIPRKYSIAKEQLSFLPVKNVIVFRKSETSKAKIMLKNRHSESVNSPKSQVYKVKKCRKMNQ